MRIDQLLPNFSWGDAIGNHALALRDTLRRWGFVSEVFARYTHPRLASESRFSEDYRALDDPGNILIYHYSIGSILTDMFARLRCRKVVIYHNITPAEFFVGINRRAAWECRRGRQDLKLLAGKTELSLGDSEYNRRELEELGYAPTGVLPIFIPLDAYRREPDRQVLRNFSDGPVILHVGRFVPNKRLEDLVKTFFFIKRKHRDARLVMVGTDVNMENYSGAVRGLAAKLELTDVVLPGHVSFEELLAYYRIAAVYLSMSEHEGFCVPLVESMIMEVPVVAYASTAVPDTLGGAGLLFVDKDYPMVAELVNTIIDDRDLRARLAAAGRRRLEEFSHVGREAVLKTHLKSLGLRVG